MGGIGTGPGETAMARAKARLPLNNRRERAPDARPEGLYRGGAGASPAARRDAGGRGLSLSCGRQRAPVGGTNVQLLFADYTLNHRRDLRGSSVAGHCHPAGLAPGPW